MSLREDCLTYVLKVQGVRDGWKTLVLEIGEEKNGGQLVGMVKGCDNGRWRKESRNKVSSMSKTAGENPFSDVQPDDGHFSETSNSKAFSYKELKTATRNFRPEGLLGEENFGKVFKGWLDENTLVSSIVGTGTIITIKKWNPEGFQGLAEWQTEVNLLGRVSHPNIVKLLGYCSEDKELLLVYEYMKKGSLEDHLFRRNPETEVVLSWDNRLKIAIGTARALTFLHSLQKQIIHRDIKTSNILLDENYNAKLSGFGLAKLGPSDGEAYVETRVMGTYGYAAPEYIATGLLYVQSDVYSFGVVLLEILTGLKAIDTNRPSLNRNLVEWAKPFLSCKRKLKTFMDARIEGQYSSDEALQTAKIIQRCLEPDPRSRPSMKEVADALTQIQAVKATSKVKTNRH